MSARRAVLVGEVLPPEAIPITTTLIVTGAIASRDFYPGHHDRDAAIAAGSRDVFMNVMTTMGLVERFVTGWTGPHVVLESLAVKLGVSNYPGDEMVLNGSVTEVRDDHDEQHVTLQVLGHNSLGAHVTATVHLRLL